MANEVTITISGLTGSGKSAIMSEVIVALKAAGVDVRTDKEWRWEMNGRSGDSFADDLESIKPVVTVREVNIPHPKDQPNG